MIWEDFLPKSLAIGVPYDVFWHLNPKKLDAFVIAHKQKMKEQDALMHLWVGTYGISALTFAIDHCLNGKKAKMEYIKELALNQVEKDNTPLDENELQRQRELFVAKLQTMKANFDLNHRNKQGE